MKAYFIEHKGDIMRIYNESVNKLIIDCGDIKSCAGFSCLDCPFEDNSRKIELKQEDLIVLEY